ncbi:hypothetical protein pipiens_006607 [Culex pipiens pipiens]|uniref:Uncharacterized protein n=1 Tax=Culex pipiens pipiens TaxID=38569 RepID=A0ABD1DPK3_CULPP
MKLALILACLMAVVAAAAAGDTQPVEAGANPQVAHAFWRGENCHFGKVKTNRYRVLPVSVPLRSLRIVNPVFGCI